jgi:hypothetical protein
MLEWTAVVCGCLYVFLWFLRQNKVKFYAVVSGWQLKEELSPAFPRCYRCHLSRNMYCLYHKPHITVLGSNSVLRVGDRQYTPELCTQNWEKAKRVFKIFFTVKTSWVNCWDKTLQFGTIYPETSKTQPTFTRYCLTQQGKCHYSFTMITYILCLTVTVSVYFTFRGTVAWRYSGRRLWNVCICFCFCFCF